MRLGTVLGYVFIFVLNCHLLCAEEFEDINFNHPSILPEHPNDFRVAKRLSREKHDYITKQRLPANLKALSYDLWFKLYFPVSGVTYEPEKNFTFDGLAIIRVQATVNSDRFIINAYNFTIISCKVTDINGVEIPINSISQNDQLQQLSLISNTNAITAGNNYTISIIYTGIINPYTEGGVYFTSYNDTNGGLHYMLATHMEPFSARKVFPGLDEPSYKALFTISLEYPTSQIALSNMKETTPVDYGNGWSFIQFPQSPLMSSYLVAFAVGPYVYASYVNKHNTLVRAWGWPGTEPYLEFAAVNSGNCLYELGEYTGIKFPLEKSDQIGMPEFLAGAMENWGLIIYKYQYIAYNSQTMTLRDKEAAAKVMCHELAHQWFGDLVTTAWWDDLFLNEGFADYFMTFTQKLVYPAQTNYFDTIQVFAELQTGLNADASSNAHPLVYPDGPAFDDITYQKGASMLRMLSDVLGVDVFKDGISRYLQSNSFSNAKDIDLFTTLTQVSIENGNVDWCGSYLNVTEFMQPYIHQINHPLIRIINNEVNLPSTFTQEPFANFSTSSPYNYTWIIPLRTTSYQDPKTSRIQWITSAECSTKTENVKKHAVQWEMGSITSATYGRIIYDDIGFDKLIKSIDENDISDNLKLQLIADEFYYSQREKNSERSNSFERFLTLVKHIYNTPSSKSLPSYSVFAQTQIGLESVLKLFRDSLDEPLVGRFYQNVFSGVYESLQWSDSNLYDSTIFTEVFLPFAVRYNIGNVQNQTLQMFQNVKEACGDSLNGTAWCNPYSTNVRKAVYCGAAKFAPVTSDFFYRMLQYYNAEVITNPYFYQEYMSLLEGMACTQSPNLLKVLIRQFVVSPLNQYTLFGFFKYNPAASDVLYNYLYSNIELLNDSRFNLDAYLDAMTYTWTRYSRDASFSQLYELAQGTNLSDDRDLMFGNYQLRISEQREYLKTYGQSTLRWLYDNTVVIGKIPWEKSLVGDIKPSQYNLILQPYIPSSAYYLDYQNMTFEASVTIIFDVVTPTNLIVLNCHRLSFEAVDWTLLHNPDGFLDIDFANVRKDYDAGVLYIPVVETLETGSYELYVSYRGFIFREPNEGNSINTYFNNNNKKGWIFTTDFEGGPSVRSLLPCFDEPSYKATFNVSVKYPSDMIALSNGLEGNKVITRDGWTEVSFATTPIMSSYLLAICVGHFSSLSKVTNNGVLVRHWSWTGMEQYGEFALNITAGTLDYMDATFMLEYGESKLDVVALPEYTQNAGAMENWGLIIGEYNLFMYDPDYATTQEIAEIAETAAHEVVHQWFGDLVTMDWWDDIFLNEGFAQYWFANGVNYTYPDQEDYSIEYNRFAINRIALEIDCDSTSKPVISDVPPVFGAEPYYKGSALLNLIASTVKEDVFSDALKVYILNYYYQNATPQNLWDMLTQGISVNGINGWDGYSLNVSAFMTQYTTLTSYPILHLERQGNTLITKQTSCLKNDNKWNIPIYSQNPNSTDFTWLVGDNYLNTSLPQGFRIENAGSTSFARVQYDDESWLQIQQQLQANASVFSPTTRAMLIDDAWFFYRSSRWNASKFLNITLYLPNEDSLAPWEVAYDFFNWLMKQFRYQEEYQTVLNYINQITTTPFSKFGYNTNDKWTNNQLANYITELNCASGSLQCRQVAKTLFDNFLKKCQYSQYGTGKCSGIHPDLRKTTYCYGILQTDNVTDFAVVDNLYEWAAANSRYFTNDRENLLNAIGCIQRTNYLDEKIYGVCQETYSTNLLRYIAENDQDGFTLFNYFSAFTQNIVQAPFDFALFLRYMTLDWNAEYQLTTLQNFEITASYSMLTDIQKRQFSDIILVVQERVTTIQTVKPALIEWIQNNFGVPNS